MNENLKPVLIAGAGPTGMMAAIELSRFNIPVRLIEKRQNPRPLHGQSESKRERLNSSNNAAWVRRS